MWSFKINCKRLIPHSLGPAPHCWARLTTHETRDTKKTVTRARVQVARLGIKHPPPVPPVPRASGMHHQAWPTCVHKDALYVENESCRDTDAVVKWQQAPVRKRVARDNAAALGNWLPRPTAGEGNLLAMGGRCPSQTHTHTHNIYRIEGSARWLLRRVAGVAKPRVGEWPLATATKTTMPIMLKKGHQRSGREGVPPASTPHACTY